MTTTKPLQVITDAKAHNEYLHDHELHDDDSCIEAILYQPSGTGDPAVIITVLHDGQRFAAKTSLAALDGAVTTLQALERAERATDDAIRARSTAAFEAGRAGRTGTGTGDDE